MIVVNETVTITVEDQETGIRFTIPAFTRPIDQVGEAVKSHLVDYLRNSLEHDTPTSVGDFILWLIRRASETEPLESEYHDD